MIGACLPGDAREIPTSVLAYIGDAVFELYVRLHVAAKTCGSSGDLHRKSITYVSAHAQADAMRRLLPLLTEAEAAVYRRARNHQTGSLPKNADPVTYHVATGFEGLVGFLYVSGAQDRLEELLRVVFDPDAGDAAPSGGAAPEAAMPAAVLKPTEAAMPADAAGALPHESAQPGGGLP